MIGNIVFDMSGVLFSCDPAAFARKYCPNPADAALVDRELFNAPEWRQTDLGTISDADYLALVLGRLPARLRPVTSFLFTHWHEMLRPDASMERLVGELKAQGCGIYLLTNMSARFYRFYRNIPAVRFFDGMLVSADVHLCKPDPEIYHVLFDRFGLFPEQCFYIDDNERNVDVGRELGMTSFCYRQDLPALEEALRAAGVRFRQP